MAEAAAADPTHAQMIKEMQDAGFSPEPEAGAAPATAQTHDQMIKEMQSAGYTPGAPDIRSISVGQPGLMDIAKPDYGAKTQQNVQGLPSQLGTIGATVGAMVGQPTAGAGIGGVTGSLAKDAINKFVYGDDSKSLGDVGKDAALEGAAQATTQFVGGKLLEGAGALAAKIGSTIVPTSVINKYKEASEAVMKLIGSNDGDIAAASNEVKKGIGQSLDEFRGQMNSQIESALKGSTERVSGAPMVDALNAAKDRIDADLNPEAKQQIEGLISKVRAKFDENGQIFVQDANKLKQYLQDQATSAYRSAGESGGGTELANAAKQAGAVARKLVNEAAPEVAEANSKLATMHYIEDRMNKNLIRELKPESALLAAGKYSPGEIGGSAANARALKLLGDLTGKDFLGKAQELAAAQVLGSAKPAIAKAGIGVLAGGATGAAIGGIADGGDGAKYGAIAGATLGGALTSPYAVRKAIDLSNAVPAPLVNAGAQVLGNAVMRGTGAQNALRKIGQ